MQSDVDESKLPNHLRKEYIAEEKKRLTESLTATKEKFTERLNVTAQKRALVQSIQNEIALLTDEAKAAMIQDVQEAFMTELDAAFATLPTHTREQTTHGNELRIRLTFK